MLATDEFGIDNGYWSIAGEWHGVSPAVHRAILGAMGIADPQAPAPPQPDVCVVRAGTAAAWPDQGKLTLEDGATLSVAGSLPPDLPLGYHDFRPDDDRPATRVIVSPGHCVVPARTAWGWAVQLYAARSRQSWGIGDLADLRALGRWARELGAGLMLINPLSAATPTILQEASPYYPSSRRFLNPLYLRIEEVPGADRLGEQLAPLAAAGRALNERRRIDRAAVYRHKLDALQLIWDACCPPEEFDEYCAVQGADLHQFATHCALTVRHGRDWRLWPDEFHDPRSPAVREFAAARAREVAMHKWMQWLLDRQFAAAADALPLVNDMPVGVDPSGADAWLWQDLLARGCSVGAPPDGFNRDGQDWAIAPFAPQRLRAAGYEPLVKTVRAGLRRAAGLRIDHVMGLSRLFWIPYGFGPVEGTYVRYRAEELLAVAAVESHRAGAFVVGEDLGTVEPEFRQQLAEHQMLSFRLACFESQPPAEYPPLAMAAVSTHDLATLAGLWLGPARDDPDVPLRDDEAGRQAARQHLARVLDLPENLPVAAAIEAVYRRLGESPSLALLVTLDDALTVREQPNVPGTIDQWPNWSLALPGGLEALFAADLPRRIAAALQRG